MNIKEIADDLRKKWQKKFSKKKVDDEDLDQDGGEEGSSEKEIVSEASMLNGDHGPIAGLNRKWVKGIAAGIILLFLAAFWYVSGDDDADKANQPKQQKIEQDKQIADGKAADSKLKGKNGSDDYEELMKRNKEAAAKNGQNPTAGKPGSSQPAPTAASGGGTSTASAAPASSSSSYSAPRETSVRPIPASAPVYPSYSTPYQLPSQAPTTQATPVTAAPAAAPAAPKESAEEQEKKKSAMERVKQMFSSAIDFNLKNGGQNGTADGGQTTAKSVNSAGPDAQQGSTAGANAAANTGAAPTNVRSTYTAPTSNMIMSGTVIPVMLLTGINSDAPGQVMAQVQADVYDYFGTTLLIPAGSRLMGTYDQQTTNGRVNITFNTLQLTNGGTWSIGNSIVAVDGAGYQGLAGKVTHHTAKKFGAGLLKSALNALSTVGARNVTIDTSAFLHDDEQNIKDTVTVKPGYQFDVYVTNNISF